MPAKTPEAARAAAKKYRESKPRTAEKRRAEHLKHKYGMTPADRTVMVLEQDGRCAICGREAKLVVDHDHETDEVRGLLCYGCNVGLGLFSDNPHILARAAEYLKEA
jgi:hypothetical protein